MATILFVSEYCLLDRKSGAARSAGAMLEALAAAGHKCHAVTLSIFDGQDEYPLGSELSGPAGQACSVMRAGVLHSICRTLSSRVEALRPWDAEAFVRLALDAVARLQPDLVLTCGGPLLWSVLRLAQLQGARTVFYLANAMWVDSETAEIRHIDDFIMPSRTLADYFCEKKGVAKDRVRVVRTIVDPLPADLSPLDHVATRRERSVTMVNPQPGKGGGFFLHLAAAARKSAPDLRFMAVESRWGRAQWNALSARAADLPNLRWHPTTEDMAAVYRQSAMLLVPTLMFEAAGRVVVEGMQAGLPVLAMDRGGIAEQIDGGGFLFDCPAELIEDPLRTPHPAILDQWLHFIRTLMRDEEFYTRAVKLALTAGDRARPDARRREAVKTFEELLAVPPVLPRDAEASVVRTLADMRAQMQGLLDRVGTQVDEAQAAGHRTATHPMAESAPSPALDRHPYREMLRFSLSQPAVKEAVGLLQRGEHDAAGNGLERYLRAMPMDYQALLLLADIFARQGHILLAQALARRAVDLAPAAAEPRLALVRYLAATREDDEAQAAGHDLAARFPDRVSAVPAGTSERAARLLPDRGQAPFDPALLSAFSARMKALFTADFFAAREGAGHPSEAPIFVIGSDVAAVAQVERWLGKYVEMATMGDLPFMPGIARHFRELDPSLEASPTPSKSLLGDLSGQELRLLAQGYHDKVEGRLGGVPTLFVDAQPRNWAFLGLIRLLFPEALIIHAVPGGGRAPLADCCAALVDHFETLAPGSIHRLCVDAPPEDLCRHISGLLSTKRAEGLAMAEVRA